MDKLKKMLMIGVLISLVSEVYINLFSQDFRVSLSVIIFPLFLLIYKQLNAIKTGLITGVLVFLFRFTLSLLTTKDIGYIIEYNYAVVFFYVIYGLLFFIMNLRDSKKSLGNLFVGIITCDLIANSMELLIRVNTIKDVNVFNIFRILAIVAMLRGVIVIIIINLLRYYKMLIVKREHEERYRNLILMISNLKSEIYFMKKNTVHIENVMKNSYHLYEEILAKEISEEMKEVALSIAKDVHEIKKDYERVIKGIETLFAGEVKHNVMNLKSIMDILEENTMKLLQSDKRSVDIFFRYSDDFKTKKHYALISVLRNLINNSIEATESITDRGKIQVIHSSDENNHVFKVIDNGVGIKEDNRKIVYEPGFSTKFNATTGDLYRGLGLALVRDVVQNYFNGVINLKSEVGKGTTFEIVIPKHILEV